MKSGRADVHVDDLFSHMDEESRGSAASSSSLSQALIRQRSVKQKSIFQGSVVWSSARQNSASTGQLHDASVSERDLLPMLEEERRIKIPSWSLQDRMDRATIFPSVWTSLLGSHFLWALIYFFAFLLPEGLRDPNGREFVAAWIVSFFIVVPQSICTLVEAIPDEDASNVEVNMRINTSILLAMTLYPCLGLWVMDRGKALTFDNFATEMNLDNLWAIKDERKRYQWGFIFPFFFWATSAFLLSRESNFAHTVDRQGVVSDENGAAVTTLFRRQPNRAEVWTHNITSFLTGSLWTLLRDDYRPSGKAGRFVFQLVSPTVFMFLYVGLRFVFFSCGELMYIVADTNNYARIQEQLQDMGYSRLHRVIIARFVVWTVFMVYCILIRFLVGRRGFVKKAVPDPQSFKKRWEGWSRIIVESKRRRVLWAFRGWANAAVPYYLCHTRRFEVVSFVDLFLWYMYLGVYTSFLMEGIGAMWFGLAEAEKGCQLSTPFRLFTSLSFWGAFNMYLQPLGTLTNSLIYLTNKEYKQKLALREIWGPLLLTDRNNFRFSFAEKHVKKPTRQELKERLQEWINTWARKRSDIGRSTDNYTVKDYNEKDEYPVFDGHRVFRGTMFPTKAEWIYMRDHHEQFLNLLPWERAFGPEKFQRWYPSYKEEIASLLREPYDFQNRREVWMFGYGSLISPESPPSGLTQDQQKQIIPYYLKRQAGYRRAWNYRHGHVGINAFGLEKVEDSSKAMNVCGCVYPMNYERASDLFSFREEGYELLFVHEDYFEPMHEDFVLPKGVGYVWVCGQPTKTPTCTETPDCSDIACKRHYPTEDSPILQTYIDTVLEGALRYKTAGIGNTDGMNFAAAIIASTVGWDHPWYNDRLLAGRPWSFTPNYELIDGLLSAAPTCRDAFLNRLRTAMTTLQEKKKMLSKENDHNKPWGDDFYGMG